jgi:drug/metabolite transporter (DMT)-like permease
MSAELATITTIVGEIALALHPILIKQLNTSLPTQLLSRTAVYTVLAAALAPEKDRQSTWGTNKAIAQSLGFGLINLAHIATSFLSYELLPAGSALAIFYTYPFFNILLGVLFLGDSFDLKTIPLLVMAFAGVVMIATYTKEGKEEENGNVKEGQAEQKGQKQQKQQKEEGNYKILLGVGAALVAAITETLIFLVAKTAEGSSPFIPILRLYPAAFLGIIAWIFFKGASVSRDSNVWIPMMLFNVFIGFLGYFLRFFSIPRLPTAIFSILTFIGVAAGYGWGLIYAKEIPSLGALGGAGLITASLGILRYIK